jgi:hypothetical protein
MIEAVERNEFLKKSYYFLNFFKKFLKLFSNCRTQSQLIVIVFLSSGISEKETIFLNYLIEKLFITLFEEIDGSITNVKEFKEIEPRKILILDSFSNVTEKRSNYLTTNEEFST